MGLSNIVKGHVNEVLGKNENLSEKRFAICKACPLYLETTALGRRCNPDLFLNPETGETSKVGKPGWYKGCGCRLAAKTRDAGSHCPAKKW